MPKTDLSFNPAEYALVADRITAFYDRYPNGRIITKLVSRDRDVVFCAELYRTDTDSVPASTGWASEREGDGEINLVACLENTETSAIGRALANLGFTASRKRPSYEEMMKAERSRLRFRAAEPASQYTYPTRPRPAVEKPRASGAESVAAPAREAPAAGTSRTAPIAAEPRRRDLAILVDLAERAGMPARRIGTLRAYLALQHEVDRSDLDRLERRLRRWITARHERLSAGR